MKGLGGNGHNCPLALRYAKLRNGSPVSPDQYAKWRNGSPDQYEKLRNGSVPINVANATMAPLKNNRNQILKKRGILERVKGILPSQMENQL